MERRGSGCVTGGYAQDNLAHFIVPVTKPTRVFSELRSHYLFEDRFGRPGKGNDKGKVEGLVGYCRRNFLVPKPRFRNFDELNAHLEACCAARWTERLRGNNETIGARLERDRAALQRLPATAFDACDKRPGRVSSLSLVRYRGTDYSVPTRFGHCQVLVRGYVHEVVISSGGEIFFLLMGLAIAAIVLSEFNFCLPRTTTVLMSLCPGLKSSVRLLPTAVMLCRLSPSAAMSFSAKSFT